MAGGLMQLVAYGAQDVYLTGNPQITLFKVVYRRHTNFSTECIELTLDTAKPGSRSTVQVLRNADLATKCYLRLVLPDLVPASNSSVAWVKRVGHAVMKNIEVQIGGSQIDKHYSTWLDVWYELTHTVDRERGYDAMVGDVPALTTLSSSTIAGGYTLFVPLQFWFCRNYGLALPLIALQYHEVRFNIEWEDLSNLVVYSGSAPNLNGVTYGSSGILVDYQYLDSEERRRFAQVGHEYLIEQMQYDERSLVSGSSQNFTLNFNHPCKEFIWTHKLGLFSGASSAQFLGYTAGDWKVELDAVAANLVESMIGTQTSGDDTVLTTVTSTTAAYTNLVLNAGTQTVFLTFTSGSAEVPTSLVFNIDNNASTANSTLDNVSVLLNPVCAGSTTSSFLNLVSRVSWASVDLTVSESGAVTVLHVETEHNLTIADVSTPLGSMVDNRSDSSSDVTVVQRFNYGAYLDGTGNILQTGNLNFNGQDRFDAREALYFNAVQPDAHHTRSPADGVYVYSFGLHPEQHQPTGTANMSRIDTARLVYKVADVARPVTLGAGNTIYDNTTVFLMVTNYNVLRIMSGMGGLAYSN